MTQQLKPERLAKRRKYAGVIYVGRSTRPAIKTGAEWRELIAAQQLRLHSDGDGTVAAYLGAVRQFEVYEDDRPPAELFAGHAVLLLELEQLQRDHQTAPAAQAVLL